MIVFLVGFVVTGCVPAFYGLLVMFGRCRERGRDGRLTVSDSVGPFGWRRRMARAAIRKFEVKNAGVSSNGPTVTSLGAFFADGGQPHRVERIEFQRLSKGLLARERSGLHLCEQRSPGFDDRVGCEEHGTNSLHFNAIAFGERLQYASIGVPDPELGGNCDVALESDSGILRDRPGGAGRLGAGEGLPALPRRTGDHVPGSQPFRNY